MSETLSTSKVLRAYPLEKDEGEPDATRAFVRMPVGAEVVNVIQNQGGFGLVALVHPSATVDVRHDLVVAPADLPVTPRLGKTFGAPLGLMPVGGKPAALLPELPWPASTLEAIAAEGNG